MHNICVSAGLQVDVCVFVCEMKQKESRTVAPVCRAEPRLRKVHRDSKQRRNDPERRDTQLYQCRGSNSVGIRLLTAWLVSANLSNIQHMSCHLAFISDCFSDFCSSLEICCGHCAESNYWHWMTTKKGTKNVVIMSPAVSFHIFIHPNGHLIAQLYYLQTCISQKHTPAHLIPLLKKMDQD